MVMIANKLRVVSSALLGGATLCLGLLGGCADPQGALDDFSERDCKAKGLEPNPSGCVRQVQAGECIPPNPGEADGDYMFVIAPQLNVTQPLLFHATITTAGTPGALEVEMTIQPINKFNRQEVIGEATTLPPFIVADNGKFTTELVTIGAPPEANPLTDVPVVADIELDGIFCAEDLSCGALGGNVIEPIDVPLEGSSFTIMKAPDYPTFPDPIINCEGDPAGPAPAP